jgi:TPR repeat protein
MILRYGLAALFCAALFPAPLAAERLTLSFLPPDLPPGDICNRDRERFEETEIQIDDGASQRVLLDDPHRVQLLSREIRNWQRTDPEGAFDFILALIDRKAELEPDYGGTPAVFDRIDTYRLAGRLDALAETGLIQSLTDQIDMLDWSDAVRVARYHLNGLGGTDDPDFARRIIVDRAYMGSAIALEEILRMQLRGEAPEYWTLSAEETAKLAFGGIVGQLDRGICHRAERIAQAYLDGDLLTPDPTLAFAWRKFAADQGGAQAAWRVVEHLLNAAPSQQNRADLAHYLQLAVGNGIVVRPDLIEVIADSGAETEEQLRRILGVDRARAGLETRVSAEPFMELDVRLFDAGIADDSEMLQFLHEIAGLPEAPAQVYTRLAREILLRKGRWTGRDEAIVVLRQAADGGDPEAILLLAELLLVERRSPSVVAEVEALLSGAVTQHGYAPAMEALEALYRCKLPGAPYLDDAEYWAEAARTADVAAVMVSANDLARLDRRYEPEVIARLQSHALAGAARSAALWLQFLQSDVRTPETVLRHWADQVARSNIALETFALQQFDLALTPRARASAAEFVARAYLDIGPAIALEYAITLLEDRGRDPGTASLIGELLEGASLRGEGAAIRLMQRLTSADPVEVFATYAEAVGKRGDFLAQMIAASHVDDATFELYMDRAISMMSCTTKDITEVAEAYLSRDMGAEALRWMRIGQSLPGGHTLAKLRISDAQIAAFGIGLSAAVSSKQPTYEVARGHGDLQRAFYATSVPGSDRFDPTAAARALVLLIGDGTDDGTLWAAKHYRQAVTAVRDQVDAVLSLRGLLAERADTGDLEAQAQLGLLLRDTAEGPDDLAASTQWLRLAARAGHAEAMVDYAVAVGFGIGRDPDSRWALTWLERADAMQTRRARDFIPVFAAMADQ